MKEFLNLTITIPPSYTGEFTKSQILMFKRLNWFNLIIMVAKLILYSALPHYTSFHNYASIPNIIGTIIPILTAIALYYDKINIAMLFSFIGTPIAIIFVSYYEHTGFLFAYPMLFPLVSFFLLHNKRMIISSYVISMLSFLMIEYFRSRDLPNFSLATLVFTFMIFASGYYICLAYIRKVYFQYQEELFEKQAQLHSLQIEKINEESQKQINQLEEQAYLIKFDEQKRIGLELHSTLAGELAALKNNIELTWMHSTDQQTRSKLHELKSNTGVLYDKVRFKSHQLFNHVELANDAPFATRILSILNRGLPKGIYRTEVFVEENLLLDQSLEFNVGILNIVKECVTNIVKHANANFVEVLIFEENNHIKLCVKDNGKGFDSKANFAGIGLKSIREIASRFHGVLKIKSNDNSTMIEVEYH